MLKLLIADDEKTIRETIRSFINWEALDIEVVGTAKNGIEAYNMILDLYPDIVLTDIRMPGLSGLELIERMHEINKDMQFIILSGYNEFEYAKTAMQYGVRHYLLKPCSEQQIIDSIKEIKQDYQTRMIQKNILAEHDQLKKPALHRYADQHHQPLSGTWFGSDTGDGRYLLRGIPQAFRQCRTAL